MMYYASPEGMQTWQVHSLDFISGERRGLREGGPGVRPWVREYGASPPQVEGIESIDITILKVKIKAKTCKDTSLFTG
jgi:hypothetical protein